MASRKTTFEERIEIATYAIEHNRNYNEASQKFQVSYQQVRSWVLKVDAGGFESLRDGRGRKKSDDELALMSRLWTCFFGTARCRYPEKFSKPGFQPKMA